MTDTKEKLVELLKLSDACLCNLCGEEGALDVVAGVIADNLIANGVTVADNHVGGKWIPVTERLPEVIDSYLVVVKYKYDFEKAYTIDTDVATYDPCGSGYIDNCWNTYTDWDEGQQYLHVTHWMPLPDLPKGE